MNVYWLKVLNFGGIRYTVIDIKYNVIGKLSISSLLFQLNRYCLLTLPEFLKPQELTFLEAVEGFIDRELLLLVQSQSTGGGGTYKTKPTNV